jgi:hypothetical protein
MLSVVVLVQSASAAYQVKWYTVDGGGAMNASGGGYSVRATIGQHDAGKLSGGGYTASGGFWILRPLAEPPDAPVPPDGAAGYDKNRYISFVPGSPGEQTALRVTLTSLPSEFLAYEDTQVWVGEPVEMCENSGQGPDVNPGDCGPVWVGGPVLTMHAATLQADQHCHDFGSVGLIHVTGCEIVPGGAYTVEAINCTDDPGYEVNYSDPLVINTSPWGNICGPYDPGSDVWTEPDTSVDIVYDVTACVDKFRNVFGAPLKPRADVDPNVPDGKINITSDVTRVLDAFTGDPYPFAGPGSCSP